MKTAVIVNPASANGRTGKRWPGLKRRMDAELKRPIEVALTEYQGHASQLARDFLTKGYDLIVSAGGDGTHNEVLNGFLLDDRPLNEKALLAPFSLGTGGDFIRTLGWPKDVGFLIEKLKNPVGMVMDVGKAQYTGLNGGTEERYFLNMVDFGMGGAVVERVNRTTKAFGGAASFLWGILTTLLRYKSPPMRYRVDQGAEKTFDLYNFIVGNGRYYGGGIKAAPQAKLDDGLLDVVVVETFGRWEAVRTLPSFRKGTHLDHPKVTWFRAGRIDAFCEHTVYIDMDGECVGTLPATFKILPGKVNVLA